MEMASLWRLPSHSSMSEPPTQTPPHVFIAPSIGFLAAGRARGLVVAGETQASPPELLERRPGTAQVPWPCTPVPRVPVTLQPSGWRDAEVQHGIKQLWGRGWWGQGAHDRVSGSFLPWLAAQSTFWRRKATEGWRLQCSASCSPPCVCWSWTGTLCHSSPTPPRAPGVRRAPSWPVGTTLLPTQEACSFGCHPEQPVHPGPY